MKRSLGFILIALGAVLVICSVVLFINNQSENKQAQELTEYYLPQLIDSIKNNSSNEHPEISDDSFENSEANESDTSNDVINGNEMPIVFIDGHGFIGYLSIPKLNLELPIMSETDYDKLKIAPCRFYGSAKTDNLIVGAHNYSRHFGQIGTLNANDEIYVTDMDGVVYKYAVVSIDILQPYEADILTNEEYDLVLFTCTYGGRTRIAVGCDVIQ